MVTSTGARQGRFLEVHGSVPDDSAEKNNEYSIGQFFFKLNVNAER